MANSENTAVNDLIASTTGGEIGTAVPRPAAQPRVRTAVIPAMSAPAEQELDPSSEALARAHAQGTPLPRGLAPVEPSREHDAEVVPVAAPFDGRSSAPTSLSPRALLELASPRGGMVRGGEAAFEPAGEHGPVAGGYADLAMTQPWTPLSPESDFRPPAPRSERFVAEHLVATMRVSGRSRRKRGDGEVKRLIVPSLLLVLGGVLVGGYIALDFGGKPAGPAASAPAAAPTVAAAAPVAASQPAPASIAPPATVSPVAPAAAAPVVAPAVTPAPAVGAEPAAGPAGPTLIDVRIDSTPSGATVMLVDRGKAQFVGTTPLSAAVDPSREYDLVFTYPTRATQLEHLDARTTRHVAVALGLPPGSATAAAASEPAPPAEPARVAERAIAPSPSPSQSPAPPARRQRASAERAPAAAPRPLAHAAPEPVGEGTLMISSKPPCDIVIDGKSTGLTTPQRSITLSAGHHKITLVNSEKDIRKTVGVKITAGATEKVIEDLME